MLGAVVYIKLVLCVSYIAKGVVLIKLLGICRPLRRPVENLIVF